MLFLIVLSDLHLGTKGKFTGICFQKTIYDLQHGSFACSVVFDKCKTFSSFDVKGNKRKQRLSGKCFGKILYMKNIISA